MVKYWDRLEPEMDARKVSISGLAKALKISFQAVAKVRDGGSFSSINNLKAAKLFDLNPEWLATGKGPRKIDAGGAALRVHQDLATYNAVTLEAAVQRMSQHLESVDGYDKNTAISLFTTLANDPSMHFSVAAGLKSLKPAKGHDQAKQSSPAQETGRSKAA